MLERQGNTVEVVKYATVITEERQRNESVQPLVERLTTVGSTPPGARRPVAADAWKEF